MVYLTFMVGWDKREKQFVNNYRYIHYSSGEKLQRKVILSSEIAL